MPARDDIYLIREEDVPISPEELFSRADASLHDASTVAHRPRRPRRNGDSFATKRPDNGRPARAAVAPAARDTRRPLAAATLSMFLCGLGQIYNRQSQLGVLFLLTEILFLSGHWALIRTWPIARDIAEVAGVSEIGLLLGVAALDAIMVVILLLNVWQAYRQAEVSEGGHFDGIASPFLSGAASLLLPGWGQLVNAQLSKALFFLAVALITAHVVGFAMLTPAIGMIVDAGHGTLPLHRLTGGIAGLAAGCAMMWILSVYDAVVVAGCRRHSA